MPDQQRGQGETEEDLRLRLELLEREHARLKKRAEAIVGPDNPCFDLPAFQKALRYYVFWFVALSVPVWLLAPLVTAGWLPLPSTMIGPLPLIDITGSGSGVPGVSFGIIALGGLSLGVVAIGGCGIGIVAAGGGAIGLVAMGGGALGVIAVGGGAAGFIAVGGGAIGRYVLAGDGRGKYVFSMRRQDKQAVEFFVRYLPRLKRAVTTPLPVVQVQPDGSPPSGTEKGAPGERENGAIR